MQSLPYLEQPFPRDPTTPTTVSSSSLLIVLFTYVLQFPFKRKSPQDPKNTIAVLNQHTLVKKPSFKVVGQATTYTWFSIGTISSSFLASSSSKFSSLASLTSFLYKITLLDPGLTLSPSFKLIWLMKTYSDLAGDSLFSPFNWSACWDSYFSFRYFRSFQLILFSKQTQAIMRTPISPISKQSKDSHLKHQGTFNAIFSNQEFPMQYPLFGGIFVGFKKLQEKRPKTTDPSPVPVRTTPFTYIFLPGKYLLHSTSGTMKLNPENRPNMTPYRTMKLPMLAAQLLAKIKPA